MTRFLADLAADAKYLLRRLDAWLAVYVRPTPAHFAAPQPPTYYRCCRHCLPSCRHEHRDPCLCQDAP